MVSQQMCMGPVFCRARSGECCLLVYISNRGLVCPTRCPDGNSRQGNDDVQDGYSLLEIFQVTFASFIVSDIVSQVYEAYILSTSSTITTTTTTTIASTITMISGNSGEVSSRNYPDNYQNNYKEVFHITVEKGSIIKLVIIDVQLENHFQCKFDYLQILDSDENGIVKIC